MKKFWVPALTAGVLAVASSAFADPQGAPQSSAQGAHPWTGQRTVQGERPGDQARPGRRGDQQRGAPQQGVQQQVAPQQVVPQQSVPQRSIQQRSIQQRSIPQQDARQFTPRGGGDRRPGERRPGERFSDRSGRNFVWDGHNYRAEQFNRRDFNRSFRWDQRRFRISPYRGPEGWSYRRWTFGQLLPFVFLAPQYRLLNYWVYNLPVPPYGCEWVRYGPDALLVDMRTGEIIEVIYGVFY